MSRLARNVIYNLAGQGLVLVLGFTAVRFVYRQLGDDAVGIIFFALTLNTVLTSVMDLGISSSVVREVAARAASSPAYMEGLLRTAALFYWTCYVVLAMVLFLAAGAIARGWLNLGALDSETAALSLRILGAGSLLALPRSLYVSLFRGLQRMGVSNAIDAGTAAIQQGGIVAAILIGGSIVGVSWWIAASTAAGVVAYILAASRVVPLRSLLPGVDTEVIRANRAFASQMTLVSLLSIIHVQTDKLIVSRLLPLGTFGLYAFGSSAVNRGMLLTGAVAQAAFPSMSQLHGESRFDSRLQNRYLRLQDLVSYASAAVFAVSPFATLPVIGLLFGPAQAETMLVPATLLALGFYMNSTLNMPYFLSLAVGKPRIALSFNAWALVIVLPTTVLLVTWWQLEGAALSWVVYNLFGYAYFVPRVCRECEGVSVWRWYLNVGRFLAMAVAVYGAAWMAVALLTETSPALLAISYSSATLVYALAGWRALSVHSRERLSAVWGAKAVESVS